jgi:microcompartment protein CcmL/EutN
MRDHPDTGPALAMLELADVPRGVRALDALVKEAPVHVLAAGTVQRGHYLILFRGQVEAVELSYQRARDTAARTLVDAVFLQHAEDRIVPSMMDRVIRWPAPGDTAGILQTGTPPTLVGAVDAALKGASVELVELRIAEGLGGKGIATIWGELSNVEAAMGAAHAAMARGNPDRCSTSIVPRADDEVVRAIRAGTRFFQEWRG